MEIKNIETKKHLTISITEEEAAVLAAAARNFYQARAAYVRECPMGTVNLRECPMGTVNLKANYAVLLNDIGTNLTRAIDHQKNEDVWAYATSEQPLVSSNGDPI
jgi:hypothetical protein